MIHDAEMPRAPLAWCRRGSQLGAREHGAEVGVELPALHSTPTFLVRAFVPYFLPLLGFSVSHPPAQPHQSTYFTFKTLICSIDLRD
jgi:hypothetical protein